MLRKRPLTLGMMQYVQRLSHPSAILRYPILLAKLSEIEDLRWIRLLYCYPEEITEELIAEIRDNPKVCHYIDMPLL